MFNQDLSVLLDDDGDFEGSNEEIRISREVFYGIGSPADGGKHEFSGLVNFGCQQHKFVGSSPSFITGSATSEASSKGSCMKDDNNGHELDPQTFMSHVVESTSEGVRYSGYLLKQALDTERKATLVSQGSEGKEIVVGNAMASPVSQESSATRALVAAPSLMNLDESGSRQRSARKRKVGTPIDLDEYDTPLTGDCAKELRPLLRQQIFRLLNDAGWSIEKRKRPCRNYEEFVFVSPQDRPVRELYKAWILCGQILLVHEHKQMLALDGRQWTSFDEFCSDLSSTLTNMHNELEHQEPKAVLAHKWVLLDPFVSVVFVGRKIKALRAGIVVKEKDIGSDTSEIPVEVTKRKRTDAGCTLEKHCDSSMASESVVIDFSRQSHGDEVEASMSRSIYIPEGSCMRLLETDDKIEGSPSWPACGSDITCAQPAGDLYDVPAKSNVGDGDIIQVSAHQDDAYDVVMHGPGDSSILKNGETDHSLDCNSKGQLSKKSKMSGIELTSLSEGDTLILTTPLTVEGDEKTNDSTNDADDKLRKKTPSSFKSCRRKTAKVKSLACQLKDDDLPISAFVQKKRFKPNSGKRSVKIGAKRRPLKRGSHKSGCRLLPRKQGKGAKNCPDARWSLVAERTVLSWLIHTGVIFPNQIIQCRDLKDETVIKDGLITKNGIRCKCCSKVHSLSKFKVHAGCDVGHSRLDLFMDSDQPFAKCLLEAWSAEYRARKAAIRAVQSDEFDQNDDSCGICGDVGELLCCDNCPSTFHQSCLSAKELPEGSWYCTSCTCWICGNLVDDEATSAHCGFRCPQCDHKYHVACLKELGMDRISSNPWFCSGSCEEVHSGLQDVVGVCNVIADGFSWSILRCIDEDQRVHSTQRFALKAECNSELAVALTIMEECFVSMVDARTGIDMIPQVVYNWGSEFPRLDYHGFYTVVLEKDDVLITVASIRVHGVEVAEMPLVATCSKYRRKGMCRRLLSAIEEILISLKVKKLVVTAIPQLVETWTVGFGFVPVEEEEKKSLNKINLMVFPGTVMLKKTLCSGQTSDLQGAGSAAAASAPGTDESTEEGSHPKETGEADNEGGEAFGCSVPQELAEAFQPESATLQVNVAESKTNFPSPPKDKDRTVEGPEAPVTEKEAQACLGEPSQPVQSSSSPCSSAAFNLKQVEKQAYFPSCST